MLTSSDVVFNNTIQFLVDRGYLERDDNMLSSTKKGTSVAKRFVDPIFFETCLEQLNIDHTITSTEVMVEYISNLLSTRSSPKPWTQGMEKNMKSQFNFNWLYKQGTHYWEFSKVLPRIQWADSLLFTLEAVKSVGEDLNLTHLVSKLRLINYCFKNHVIPYPLVQIGLKLKRLGLHDIGAKYLLYLHCNDVFVDEKDTLHGPTEFKSPSSGSYDSVSDRFTDVTFSRFPVRYHKAAEGLARYYGKTDAEVSIESDDVLMLPDDEPDNPWGI